MLRSRTRFILIAALALLPCLTSAGASEGTKAEQVATNPLAPFERAIGGEWHLEGTVHALAWGLERQTVTSRTWFETEKGRELVSEGLWFWHPGEKAIRGYVFAKNMPVRFFEYTTRFEGDTMTNDLVTYAPDGTKEIHRETWVFEGTDRYVWTLYSKAGDAMKRSMGGTFVRKAAAAR